MLTGSDILGAKMIVQLGLVPAGDVRAELKRVDEGTFAPGRDLINRLSDMGRLSAKDVELLRHRVALYEHVRGEATYLRFLEKNTSIDRKTVAKLLAELELSAYRRRLGEVLVRQGKLKKEQDTLLDARQRELLEKEDQKIVERYRAESFEGIARPLIPSSRLDPEDFKISKLFRGKETRALVDQEELRALKADAAAQANDATRAKTSRWEPGMVAGDAPAPPEAAPAEAAPAASMDRVRNMKRIADYSIIEVLGVGGMGAVFLGQKDGAGEYAAIKVMLNQAATKQETGRFEREIALGKRISHKNVIGIIESGATKEGLTYLVVPTLVGKELRALLDATGGKGLPTAEVCHVFEQVLEGMAAVHATRIVHRDLKPENIMVLGKDHDVKIMDFGLAKLDDEADQEASTSLFRTTTGEVVGSPTYIAPESITRDGIDARTDIYSLGIILFELLTGKLPLESESAAGYLTQHLVSPPLTLKEGAPDRAWPQEVEDLIAKMLAKTKDERPKSCNEVLAVFRGGLREKLIAMEQKTKTGELPAVPHTAVYSKEEVAKGHVISGLLGRLLGKKK